MATLYHNEGGKPLFNPRRLKRLPGETRKAYKARKQQHLANLEIAFSKGYFFKKTAE